MTIWKKDGSVARTTWRRPSLRVGRRGSPSRRGEGGYSRWRCQLYVCKNTFCDTHTENFATTITVQLQCHAAGPGLGMCKTSVCIEHNTYTKKSEGIFLQRKDKKTKHESISVHYIWTHVKMSRLCIILILISSVHLPLTITNILKGCAL